MFFRAFYLFVCNNEFNASTLCMTIYIKKSFFPVEYDFSTLCRIDHLAIHRDIARKTSILLNINFCVWKNMRLIWQRRTVKIQRWWVTKKQKKLNFQKKIFFKTYFSKNIFYSYFLYFFQQFYLILFYFKILKIVQNGPAVAKLVAYFSIKIQIILFKILEIVAASPKIENTYIVLYIPIQKK